MFFFYTFLVYNFHLNQMPITSSNTIRGWKILFKCSNELEYVLSALRANVVTRIRINVEIIQSPNIQNINYDTFSA